MYFGWKPYVPVAERRRKAERAAARSTKNGDTLSPIRIAGQAIAKTFWGKAWCSNMEQYSDYSNRLPRGRTYVRNGSVIDLQVVPGEIRAQVVGSSLYKTTVKVAALPMARWNAITTTCAHSIDTLVELLQGRFAKGVMECICRPEAGLFPAPKEIEFDCSCPDWASMCKHVAAVLYGVGARLDEKPELLFTLRRVDPRELVAQASTELPLAKKAPAAGRVLDSAALADVFGIEMAQPAAARAKRTATKRAPAKRSATRKPPAKRPHARKVEVRQTPAAGKRLVKKSGRKR